MKISKSNKYTRSIALGLSLLVSTSLLSGCNDDRHLHVYEKQGVVKLIESENRIVDGYIKTEDTIPYDKDLDYELQVLDYYGLVRVNDNVSYIENSMLENKPYIEYEYVYYKEDVKHYFDVNNIRKLEYYKNPIVIDLLVPIKIELPSNEYFVLKQKLDILIQFGFKIEE